MSECSPRTLRILADMDSLSQAAAAAVVEAIGEAVQAHDRCLLALAGGATPRLLYQLLATRYRGAIPWRKLHCFFGDERYVPVEDPRSNYRMVKETLLDHARIPEAQVHPVPTHFGDPREAAAAYEELMRTTFSDPWPRFDLVLLGLGEDGHTASLFPGSPILAEKTRWVAPSLAPTEPQRRVTMTYPVFNHAARVYFLVSGPTKAKPLQAAFREHADPQTSPSAGVHPTQGELIWWVDEAATAKLRYPQGD